MTLQLGYTQQLGGELLGVQGQPELPSELQDSLSYKVRPCLKNKQKRSRVFLKEGPNIRSCNFASLGSLVPGLQEVLL